MNIPFECLSPDIDETMREFERPLELAGRLAAEKAGVVSSQKPEAIVIGSDQLAVFSGRILGKPGYHAAALEQLSSFSGQVVEFLTAVSVQCLASGFNEVYIDTTRVKFRHLQTDEIERYLQAESPYDCAGAFKAEALGITLFDSISSEDPTALIGLPLIRTAAMLRRAGLSLP